MKRQHDPGKESVNSNARRDDPNQEHDDLVQRDGEGDTDAPKPYQEAELEPRDQGGIAE